MIVDRKTFGRVPRTSIERFYVVKPDDTLQTVDLVGRGEKTFFSSRDLDPSTLNLAFDNPIDDRNSRTTSY
jgi:hypothetical protein